MGFHAGNLLNRLSNVFTKDPNSNLGQMMGAVGAQLDKVDPAQTNLEASFSVSTATGSDLDTNGKDWGVPRQEGESDTNYRNRILAYVPIYTTGPTRSVISQIVQNFTGSPPTIIEYGPDSFFMGVTPMGQFIFDSNGNDQFTFQIQVSNPNNIPYVKSAMESSINAIKPARSTVIFVHQGGI